MHGFSRHLKASVILGLAIVAGSVLGQVAGWFLEQQKNNELSSYREEAGRQLVDKLRRPGVEDSLFNHVFSDYFENQLRLSELVTGKTIVAIVRPDCRGCMIEMSRLRDRIKEKNGAWPMMFIVENGDPVSLEYMHEQFGWNCIFLRDDSGFVGSILETIIYPMFLVLEADGAVEKVIPGRLPSGYIDSLGVARNP